MEQQLGPEAKGSLDLVGGKLVGSVEYKGADLSAKLDLEFNAEPVLKKLAQKLKDAIPGGIDDMIIDAAIASAMK